MLYWILLGSDDTTKIIDLGWKVSTLVVLDFAWKLTQTAGIQKPIIVSTLVVLDFAWKHPNLHCPLFLVGVSTLVVLDFAWKQLLLYRCELLFHQVSTLVVLDFAWKRVSFLRYSVGDLEFQPLLYWILLGSPSGVPTMKSKTKRFNPCCIGFCLEANEELAQMSLDRVVSTLVVLDFAWKRNRWLLL